MSDHADRPRGVPGQDREVGPVGSRVDKAFSEELAAAEADLESVPWVSGIPRGVSNGRSKSDSVSSSHSGGAGRLLQAAVAAVLAIVVAIGVLPLILATGIGQAPSPYGVDATPNSAVGATPRSSGSVDATPRYDDGIPRVWQGEAVLRGQAALSAAGQARDASSFLIAFWTGYEPPRSCGDRQVPSIALNSVCLDMLNVGDRAGLVSTALGQALRVDSGALSPGPVIARVHTHDSRALACAQADVVRCNLIMIAESIVWSGDYVTAPHPSSVKEAAATFRVSEEPIHIPACAASALPGVPILESFPAGASTPDEIIAVFPSAEALQTIAPQTTEDSASDVPLVGVRTCSSLNVQWLARGNVLVGVPFGGQILAQARVDLQTLPAR